MCQFLLAPLRSEETVMLVSSDSACLLAHTGCKGSVLSMTMEVLAINGIILNDVLLSACGMVRERDVIKYIHDGDG